MGCGDGSLAVSRRGQHGAALLVFLLVIVTGASFFLLEKLDAGVGRHLVDHQATAQALSRAKAALIGYALTYAERHPGQPQGFLPCPDLTGDGRSGKRSPPGPPGPCGAAGESVMGWLPWHVLRIPPLRDGAGECLWYAVSGNYKNNPKVSLTSDTDGQLIVKSEAGQIVVGSSSSERAVAIVFAPGSIVGNQSRGYGSERTECGGKNPANPINQPQNYLESLNGIDNSQGTESGAGSGQPGSEALPTATASVFISAPYTRDATGNVLVNDHLMPISPRDFMPVYARMDRWVAEKVRGSLDAYATNNAGKYPWASRLDASSAPDYSADPNERFGRIPTVISDPASWRWWDGWKEMVFYAMSKDKAPGPTAGGVLELDGSPADAVILVSGRKILSQDRTTNSQKADISNYLEGDLEGDNDPGGSPATIPPGDERFVSVSTPPFNDVACTSVICP